VDNDASSSLTAHAISPQSNAAVVVARRRRRRAVRRVRCVVTAACTAGVETVARRIMVRDATRRDDDVCG
jgi:hypothetical protein